MAAIKIRQGMDLHLEGAARTAIDDAPTPSSVHVYPPEFKGIKPRLRVKEGDAVKIGTVLFVSKQDTRFQFLSPAGGVVRAIEYGARRVIQRIEIAIEGEEQAESFPRHTPDALLGMGREQALDILLQSGLLALIRQRPFSRIANPEATPKSIFVNAMSTAPLQGQAEVLLQGHEAAFQAGINLLARLTDGPVHLCLKEDSAGFLPATKQASVHTFSGPHPSGNASTHIHFIDPISPGDTVWTLRAADVALIGRLLLEGRYPVERVVCLAGNGLRPEARAYCRTRLGAPLSSILDGRLAEGEPRIIGGSVLDGDPLDPAAGLRFRDQTLTVIPEGRERHFMGWLAPGLDRLSHSRLYLSTWLARNRSWAVNTSRNGSKRAMVMTGWYDPYTPLDILVDYLVRAVLAHDTDEAIKLGILGTDPEDFALCTFICPSKTDVGGLIRQGLDEIEAEGI